MNNNNFRSICMNINYPCFTSVNQEEKEEEMSIKYPIKYPLTKLIMREKEEEPKYEKASLSSQNQKKIMNDKNEYNFSKNCNYLYSSSSLIMEEEYPYFWDDLINYPSIEDMIKSIPDYYPIECTHTTVYLKNMRDFVIPNLRHCFRTLGIQVIMDKNINGSDGNATLITKEYTNIHLYFWKMQKQQQDDSNYNTKKIYLELQRRQGDSILYHRYVKQILKAATATTDLTTQNVDILKYDDDDSTTPSSNDKTTTITAAKLFPSPLIRKIRNDLRNVDENLSEASKSISFLLKNKNNNYNAITARTMSPEQRTKELTTIIQSSSLESLSLYSIQKTISLLKSKNFDSQMLGMESLCILTDLNKTNRSIAYLVSHDIIFGNNRDDDSSFLHTLVFKLILLLQQLPEEERTQSLLENRDVGSDYDSDYYHSDVNDDHITYLFQQHDDGDDDSDDDDDDDCDGYDIRKLLPNSLGFSRKSYHNSVAILRNYALTTLSNAWEVLLSQDTMKNNKEENKASKGTKIDGKVREIETTSTIYPTFSLAVMLTATKILNQNVKLQQQHQSRSKEYYSDNNISNDDIIDLIIQTLWKDIAFAMDQPHNACLAIRCLLSLICLYNIHKDNEDDINNAVLSTSGKNLYVLQQAELIGKATNQRLEILCQELLRQTSSIRFFGTN